MEGPPPCPGAGRGARRRKAHPRHGRTRSGRFLVVRAYHASQVRPIIITIADVIASLILSVEDRPALAVLLEPLA